MRSLLALAAMGGTALANPPPVTGTRKTVQLTQQVTLGGMTLTFASATHKRSTLDGGAQAAWTFTASKGRATETIALSAEPGVFQAEARVHGASLVFQRETSDAFTITRIANAPPLTEAECNARIRAAATRAKLSLDGTLVQIVELGIAELRTPTWRGYCGTLSKRVWLQPPVARTRPPLAQKLTPIALRSQVTLGGTPLRFVSATHKSGSDLGMWLFRGARSEIELRSNRDGFQAEVVLDGAALVFEHRGYEAFAVAKLPTAKPLSEAACIRRLTAAAVTLGLPALEPESVGSVDGFVRVVTTAWAGTCGTLTQRVWLD